MEERILEIETKLAYQEDLLQALNDIVAEQQKTIDVITAQYRSVKDQLKTALQGNGGDEGGSSEVPPHY